MAKEKWIPEGDGWTEKNVARLLDIWQGELDLAIKQEERLLTRLEQPDPEPTELQIQARQAEVDRAKAQLLDAQVRAHKEGLNEPMQGMQT